MQDMLLLIVAGLGAGALNAIAGGGTFLSFPALVWVGVPPVMANATATFAALPGYIGSAWAYRKDIGTGIQPPLIQILIASGVGGLLGALLLLVTPAKVFSGVVPWLLLLATVIFAIGPSLVQRFMGAGRSVSTHVAIGALLIVSIYGGYFNGGLGIMLLAAFGMIGMSNLHQMNGLKNVVSAVLSTVSVATYVAAGLIDWGALLVVGTSCAIGGYLGGYLARKIDDIALLRVFIVVVGLVMALIFFVR